MSTLISGTASWLPAAEFLKRVDVRTIADVLGDAGIRLYQTGTPPTTDLTALAGDATLAALLKGASGQFEADVFVGGRYTPADLTLILATDCNAREYMWDLIARIVRARALDRRLTDPEARVPEWYKETKEQLKRIRDGDAIFGFLEHAEAGTPKVDFMQKADWDAVQTTVSQASPLFGRRNKDFRRPGF